MTQNKQKVIDELKDRLAERDARIFVLQAHYDRLLTVLDMTLEILRGIKVKMEGGEA